MVHGKRNGKLGILDLLIGAQLAVWIVLGAMLVLGENAQSIFRAASPRFASQYGYQAHHADTATRLASGHPNR